MLTLRQLQEEARLWQDHNFPDRTPTSILLGIAEELGELCRAQKKGDEGIRGTPAQHLANAKEEVGDLIISVAAYCDARDFDMQQCMEDAWFRVKQRDWVRYPETGRASEGASRATAER